VPVGIVLVDRSARVVWTNLNARLLVQSGDGIALRDGRLVATAPEKRDALASLVGRVLDPTERRASRGPEAIMVPRSSGLAPLVVVVRELGAPDEHPPAGATLAVVFVSDPDHGLREFEPTRAEAESRDRRLTGVPGRAAPGWPPPSPTGPATDARVRSRYAPPRMSDFWHLHGLDWLAELSDAETARLLRTSSSREFARGATIFEPVANPQSVYLLERGLVRIYRLSAKGDEATLGYVRPGEVFAELGAFSDHPRESFAQAVRPSRVLRVPREELRRILDAHPRIALSVTMQIGNRFKRIESRVESLVFRNLRSRVAHILLELAEDFGRPEEGRILIDLPLSQQDVATLVGATRQSVNLCLREMREAKLVDYRNRRFALPDPTALRRDAGAEMPPAR
jgi:CRP-like cAMP-binding protein